MAVPYLTFFNLKEEPFTTTANPRFFYQSPIHSIALGKTEFIVDAKKGLTIVFGDTGYGKSTLARLLHGKFREKGYISVLLTNPNYPTTNSLLRTIIQEFQLPKTSKAFKENLDIFKAYLYEQAVSHQKTVVLIIDAAQTLRIPLLELLRQIINYETNDMKLLQLVLFSQEQLRTKLTHPLARNFRSRIALASTLEAMGQNEHAELIDFRWRVASGNQPHPFTPDAVEAIYLHSKGMPREACILADNALLAAYLAGKKVVDKATVDAAYQDRVENIGEDKSPTTTKSLRQTKKKP
jgi:general secretion pathway protein A